MGGVHILYLLTLEVRAAHLDNVIDSLFARNFLLNELPLDQVLQRLRGIHYSAQVNSTSLSQVAFLVDTLTFTNSIVQICHNLHD